MLDCFSKCSIVLFYLNLNQRIFPIFCSKPFSVNWLNKIMEISKLESLYQNVTMLKCNTFLIKRNFFLYFAISFFEDFLGTNNNKCIKNWSVILGIRHENKICLCTYYKDILQQILICFTLCMLTFSDMLLQCYLIKFRFKSHAFKILLWIKNVKNKIQ